MQMEMIEEILVREFRGLCSSCIHIASCSYFKKNSHKDIIQCELFEVDDEIDLSQNSPGGLCKTCDLRAKCRLPKRKVGTWHCDEFQ